MIVCIPCKMSCLSWSFWLHFFILLSPLTYLGRVTHICVSKLIILVKIMVSRHYRNHWSINVSIYYMSNINELPDGILFHWFCKCTPPWMFLPLDIPSEYRPEHVTFGLLCVIFKFPSRIFCRRVPGFATDCPCGVWCRGLTTCLLYVGPPLEF